MSEAGTSISETIAALDAPPPEKEQVEAVPAAQAEETELEAVPTAEDTDEPETAIESDATGEDEPEGDEPVQRPLNPPHFWDADDKSAFSKLPREEQERVLKYDVIANRANAQALESAAIARKEAQAAASKFNEYSASLDKLLPKAEESFKSKWPDNIDWAKTAEQYGVEEAFKMKTQYESEQGVIQQLRAAKNEADSVQSRQFINDRAEQFKTVVPDLADAKEGPKRQLELVKYLTGQGINPDVIIKQASANELGIAYKAMLWDKANSKATELAAKPKPAAPLSKTNLKPTGSIQRGSQQSAVVKSLEGRFAKDPSVKNLTALLEAKG